MQPFTIALNAIAFVLAVSSAPAGQLARGSIGRAETIVISGSSTMYPLVTEIARRFQRTHPDTKIEVQSGGSGKGIADLRFNLSGIAMVSRPLFESERDLFAFPVCRDGAAIVVHQTNRVNELSARQLTEILTGNTTDWKDVGGTPGPIRLAWRTEGHAIPELLLRALKLKPDQIRGDATIFENADAVKFVVRNPDAITAVALGVAERAVKSGEPVKLLAYDGVPASTRTVRDHTYPLSRPLLLVTRAIPTGVQKTFIHYATSPVVTDLNEKLGFVSYRE